VDSILRETASKAVAREPPLSLREMRERWNDLVEKRNAFQLRSGGRFDNSSGKQDGGRQVTRGGGARGRGGSAATRSGPAPQSRGAKYQGHNVCYHFNRPSGCKRPVKGTGCDNGNNGEYAHVCNFRQASTACRRIQEARQEWFTEAFKLDGTFYQSITVGSNGASFNVSSETSIFYFMQ